VRRHERLVYAPLPAELARRLASAWAPAFAHWGYECPEASRPVDQSLDRYVHAGEPCPDPTPCGD